MSHSGELITSKTKQCLEKHLKALGVHSYEIKVTASTAKGENFLGIIAKVAVTGKNTERNNVMRHFVVKSAPTNEMIRTILPINVAYEREAYMYNVVLTEFSQLQTEKKVSKPFKSFAIHYESLLDDKDEAIILEDMNKRGFHPLLDRKQPINYEHTAFILREYGKFHALAFALRLHKPDLFREMAKNTEEKYLRSVKKEMRLESYKNFSLKAFSTLEPTRDKELYDKYSKFHDKIDEIALEVTNSDVTNPYYVFSHGDCWINNFLFKYENTNDRHAPKEVCFLDWQLACFGSPALDLSYFIFSNTDKSMRDKYYDKLLEEYYNSFRSFLKELGGNPEKQFPFDVLKSQMKQHGTFGLIWCTQVLFISTSENEDLPDFQKSSNTNDILERTNNNTKHIEFYNSRIRDVITDVARLGLDHF